MSVCNDLMLHALHYFYKLYVFPEFFSLIDYSGGGPRSVVCSGAGRRTFWNIFVLLLSASLYFSKRGAY